MSAAEIAAWCRDNMAVYKVPEGHLVEAIPLTETGKVQKVRIVTVIENPCNPHYVQRNIITRSAVVGTDLGDVLITSRPGQDGALNGVLIGKQ